MSVSQQQIDSAIADLDFDAAVISGACRAQIDAAEALGVSKADRDVNGYVLVLLCTAIVGLIAWRLGIA